MHELYKLEGPLKEKGDEQLIEDWFYFTSRERHTRWNCDWSSDVCSSDLLVQSGKPVGVFRTHEWAPRVLIANSNLVGDWATWPEFRHLEQQGLTMYGQMTAGSWIYIGTQGKIGRASCRERV